MFGKLYSQTFSGSMVGKGSTVFATWAYVVAHTKPPGIVELNPVLIAAQIGTTAADVESAIEYLCAADPNSRTPDHEGRRMIREGQFQYSVPNYMRYRGLRNEEERREQDRERKRRSRKAHKGNGEDHAYQDAAFAEFWELYPRKVGRAAALKAWRKLAPEDAAVTAIKQAVERQRKTWTDPKYIPHAATWLHGARWQDEMPVADGTALRPAITCAACGQRAHTWTGDKCDPCYRAYMGITDNASQAPAK